MIVVEIAFWSALALIVYTHIGYPLVLRALVSMRRRHPRELAGVEDHRPSVSLIVAAHDEEAVIERRLANALALDYPANKLDVIVASDGSSDRTVALAERVAQREPRVRVLDLPRRGKVRAQDAAVEHGESEILAFSDANACWETDALTALVQPFRDRSVGYVCGELRYLGAGGSNQEGTYWRYENALRRLESELASITAGNGAIYAVRRGAYLRLDPRTSHDLSFPFNLVKRGWLALCEPRARATERVLATVEGEFRRKRRMMSHAWPMIVRGGMLSPRGYGLLYGFEILSHRVLRYVTPFLHAVVLATNVVLLGEGTVYGAALAGQLALLGAAASSRVAGGRVRLLSLSRYYVLMTASSAAGLWDWLHRGTPATWEKAEGRG